MLQIVEWLLLPRQQLQQMRFPPCPSAATFGWIWARPSLSAMGVICSSSCWKLHCLPAFLYPLSLPFGEVWENSESPLPLPALSTNGYGCSCGIESLVPLPFWDYLGFDLIPNYPLQQRLSHAPVSYLHTSQSQEWAEDQISSELSRIL